MSCFKLLDRLKKIWKGTCSQIVETDLSQNTVTSHPSGVVLPTVVCEAAWMPTG